MKRNALLPLLVALTCAPLVGCNSGGTVDTSKGAYGKAGSETTLPPQGKPPAPGTDMSKRTAPEGRK